MPEFCQVTTTTGSRDAAGALARSMVEARLAACAQVLGPITSTYWWNGAVETAEEWQVQAKTHEDRRAALEDHIRQHHSYDVPEIVVTPIVAGHRPYLDWVRTEVRA